MDRQKMEKTTQLVTVIMSNISLWLKYINMEGK